MPAIEDYSQEEDKDPGEFARRSTGGGSGGAQLANATPQKESTFVPWSRFMSANQDVASREANKLNAGVSGEVNAAKKAADDASAGFNAQIESNYSHEGDQQPAQSGSFAAPNAAGAFGQPATTADAGAFGSRAPPPPPTAGYSQKPTRDQLGEMAKNASGVAAPNGLEQTKAYAAPQAGNRTGLKPGAVDGPAGAKDVESYLGADAWSKLMGDTVRAQGDASALGSETGVQGLIQQQAAQPLAQGGAFDAALINGQGQTAFGQTTKAGAGLGDSLLGQSEQSQNAWHTLMGDVNEVKRQNAATAEANATNQANADARTASDKATRDAQQQELEKQRAYLKEKFPVAPQFDTQRGFLDWVGQNRSSPNSPAGQAGYSNIAAWADQIYGNRDPSNPYKNIDQFYADLKKMTPEEYEAFKYGVVPAWMGQGAKASGANGGQFWGLGNTGNRNTGTTTNSPTAENAQSWEEKQAALKAYYSILEAIAMAGA